MDEAYKTEKIRGPEFRSKYFSGKVLDIGCGNNLVFLMLFLLIKIRGMPRKFWIILNQILLIACIVVIIRAYEDVRKP
ncbi:MAG: hypothetical protein CM1200mP16_07790 [Nitrospina sp.]|nr:MAG: hypothetical protein CM1200mP16_07790 [Nitrospina sp.]